MLPSLSGLEVLRRLRARGNDVPVLVLTAKGAEEDVVLGLESGADDYVTKPFAIRELVARAKGLLRRPRASGAAKRLPIGEAVLDVDRHEVSRASVTVTLTLRETLPPALVERASARLDARLPGDVASIRRAHRAGATGGPGRRFGVSVRPEETPPLVV